MMELLFLIGYKPNVVKLDERQAKDVPTATRVTPVDNPRTLQLGDQVIQSAYDYPNNAFYKWLTVDITGNVHVAAMRRLAATPTERSIYYNVLTGGTWVFGNTGVDAIGFSQFGYNGFGNVTATPSGFAVVSTHLNDSFGVSNINSIAKMDDASYTFPTIMYAFADNCIYPKILALNDTLFLTACEMGDGTGIDSTYVFLYNSNTNTLTQVHMFEESYPEVMAFDYNPVANKIVLSYFEQTATSPSWSLKYIESTDFGQTWDTVTVMEAYLVDTILDGLLPIDTFQNLGYNETNPFCTEFLRHDIAVTDDGTVHVAWEAVCYDGTHDTIAPDTVDWISFARINYWNSVDMTIEEVVSQPHAGREDTLTSILASINTPAIFAPKFVKVGNDVMIVFGWKHDPTDLDGNTGVANPDLFVAYKQAGAWTTQNMTNSAGVCELWPSVAERTIGGNIYIMYYHDSQCGISLFGEGTANDDFWYVFTYASPLSVDEVSDNISRFYTYNPVSKELLFNLPSVKEVRIYTLNGRFVVSKKVSDGVVSLRDLSSGIYVVKANNLTAKVIVR